MNACVYYNISKEAKTLESFKYTKALRGGLFSALSSDGLYPGYLQPPARRNIFYNKSYEAD